MVGREGLEPPTPGLKARSTIPRAASSAVFLLTATPLLLRSVRRKIPATDANPHTGRR